MGWNLNKLSRIADIGAGNSAPQKKELFEGGIHSFIRTSDVGLVKFGVISDSRDKLNNDGIKKLRKVLAGSVLVPKSGASTFLNHRVSLSKDSYVSSHLATIKANQRYLEDGFLLYFLLTIKAQDLVQDHDYPSLRLSDLANIEVPTPSVPEQKRIVAILDQAFADIEQARAKTEQNLKNARELFESYLQQVFSQRGEGWTETNLGAVAGFKNGLNFSQSSKGEKLKVVGVKDFKSNFMVPFEQLDTIQIDGDLSEAYELKENDIITVRSNGNKRLIGRCLLMGKVDDKTSYSGFTIRIRLEDKSISPRFLAYYLKSSSTHELLINSGEGANISNLNQKILTSLPVAFPHLDKQMKLVEGIEKVESETKKLENIYANKLNTIDKLKKSILQKAFSGELTKEKEGAMA